LVKSGQIAETGVKKATRYQSTLETLKGQLKDRYRTNVQDEDLEDAMKNLWRQDCQGAGG